MERHCGNCKAYDLNGSLCRRFPPSFRGTYLLPDQSGFTDIHSWPQVKQDDWCREHVRTEEAQAEEAATKTP